jgi:hypothetical protein
MFNKGKRISVYHRRQFKQPYRNKQYTTYTCSYYTIVRKFGTMKIIHTKSPVNIHELKVFLQERLSPLFKKQRMEDIDFVFTETGNGMQITQPDMYEDFLFNIERVGDTELHVTKSEHYTDDVNVLTLEDIMNNLFMEYPGRDNIANIAEES